MFIGERTFFMKRRNNIFVLLLLALLIAAVGVESGFAASHYSDTTYSGETQLTHSFMIEENDHLDDPLIQYTFTIVSDPNIAAPTLSASGVNIEQFVTGAPKFKDTSSAIQWITYTDSDRNPKTLTIVWSDVTFKQPGSYYWKITKIADPAASADTNHTNNNETLYIYAVVNDDETSSTKLSLSSTGFGFKNIAGNISNQKFNTINDTYNSDPVDFTIAKTVTGEIGSKDRYFKFVVTIDIPDYIAAKWYTVSGDYDESGTDIFEYSDFTNPSKTQKHLIPANPTSFTIYLKHGQNLTFNDLPDGTVYSIAETTPDGYTSTYAVSTGDTSRTLNRDTTVTYTNTATDTPTGLILETAAPVVGLLLGAAFLAIVAASRKKKANNR